MSVNFGFSTSRAPIAIPLSLPKSLIYVPVKPLPAVISEWSSSSSRRTATVITQRAKTSMDYRETQLRQQRNIFNLSHQQSALQQLLRTIICSLRTPHLKYQYRLCRGEATSLEDEHRLVDTTESPAELVSFRGDKVVLKSTEQYQIHFHNGI
jgi:hypothetical protein